MGRSPQPVSGYLLIRLHRFEAMNTGCAPGTQEAGTLVSTQVTPPKRPMSPQGLLAGDRNMPTPQARLVFCSFRVGMDFGSPCRVPLETPEQELSSTLARSLMSGSHLGGPTVSTMLQVYPTHTGPTAQAASVNSQQGQWNGMDGTRTADAGPCNIAKTSESLVFPPGPGIQLLKSQESSKGRCFLYAKDLSDDCQP